MQVLRWALVVPLTLLWWLGTARAGIPLPCAAEAEGPETAAVEWERLLQWTAAMQLDLRGDPTQPAPAAVLVSRSGLNLQRLGHTLSHAGWLRPQAQAQAAWSVRQLYFDCGLGEARVFDEGLAGFVRGVAQDVRPRISAVVLPAVPARAVADVLNQAPSTPSTALPLPRYQANAHIDDPQAQNCNLWALEVAAVAAAGLEGKRLDRREQAQAWLRAAGHAGSAVVLPSRLWMWAAAVWPQVGWSGHPRTDVDALRFRTSLPADVEAWMGRHWPEARRIEWCVVGSELRTRRGWTPFDADCTLQADDRSLPLTLQ